MEKYQKIRIKRKTLETDIDLSLNINGSGKHEVNTGIGFLNHLLSTFSKHSLFDMKLVCKGDLNVDDHHTAEDCFISLGEALRKARESTPNLFRFGWAIVPMDDSLARASVDLSGRPFAVVDLKFSCEFLGELKCENITHCIQTLAFNAKCNIHLDVLRGENNHHKAEASFKALAYAMKQAFRNLNTNDINSTKGVIK